MKKLLVKKVNVNNYEEEPFFILETVNRDNFDFIYIIEECCQIYKNMYNKHYFFEVRAVDEKEVTKTYSALPEGCSENLLAYYIRTHFSNYSHLLKKDADSLVVAKQIIRENQKQEIKKITVPH